MCVVNLGAISYEFSQTPRENEGTNKGILDDYRFLAKCLSRCEYRIVNMSYMRNMFPLFCWCTTLFNFHSSCFIYTETHSSQFIYIWLSQEIKTDNSWTTYLRSINAQTTWNMSRPGANIDSDHNILISKTCSMLKKIINFQKAKPGWDLGKLYSQQ